MLAKTVQFNNDNNQIAFYRPSDAPSVFYPSPPLSSPGSTILHIPTNSAGLRPPSSGKLPKAVLTLNRALLQGALRYDARLLPTFIQSNPLFAQPATSPAVTHLNLIATRLPWVITVGNPNGVTVADVILCIYQFLAAPCSDSELKRYAAPEEQMRIWQAFQFNNQTCRQPVPSPLKVDWLRSASVLTGLVQDFQTILQHVQNIPGASQLDVTRTWVLDFQRPTA